MPNLGNISTLACVDAPPPPDHRCDDEAYALSNPTLCPPPSRFILKPGAVLLCELGSVQFAAFTIINGVELDVTELTVFTSSDQSVIRVGLNSGSATAFAHGVAAITGTYGELSAQVEVTVLVGDDCCDDQTVALMVLVDQTASMNQDFTGYQKKLGYAKVAATAFINSINESKDLVGLARFTKESTTVIDVPSSDKDAVAAHVPLIVATQDKTAFYNALSAAVAALSLVEADRRILLLISDGEDTTPSYVQFPNPIQVTEDFKAAGGIVLCLGVRAHDAGYSLLSALSTGGFFVNAYDIPTATSALDFIIGLKGYICGGGCTPDGDVIEHHGQLGYTGLANWWIVNQYPAMHDQDTFTEDSAGCYVDLHGNGFFDYLPNNGLYVELMADASAVSRNPHLVSKEVFAIGAGEQCRVSVTLAGNQVQADYTAQAMLAIIEDGGVVPVTIFSNLIAPDYQSGFQKYGFTWTQVAPANIKIAIYQYDSDCLADAGSCPGILLKRVTLESLTSGLILLDDDFNSENEVYVPPKCGAGTVYHLTGIDTTILIVSGGGGANGIYTKVGDYLYSDGDVGAIILREDGRWHLELDGSDCYASPVGSLLGTWTVEAGECGGPAPTVQFGSTYGYTTGYNCYDYGDGCLESPPPAQLQDPHPLPVLEGGFVPGGNFTSTSQPVCASCRPGYVNIGQPLASTAHATDEDYQTAIKLAASTKIRSWQVEFLRSWLADDSVPAPVILPSTELVDGTDWQTTIQLDDPAGILAFDIFYRRSVVASGLLCLPPDRLPVLEGTNNNNDSASWQVVSGWYPIRHPAGDTVTVALDSESAHFKYYRATGFPSCGHVAGVEQTGKIFTLTVYGHAAVSHMLVLSGSANGTAWTPIESHPEITGGPVLIKYLYRLPSESASYRYYRAQLGPGDGSGSGKVLELKVYATAPELVCKTASGTGTTQAEADKDASAKALAAAQAALDCRHVYSSTQLFQAVCPDGSGAVTASATAESLNSEDDALHKAAIAAEVAAKALLRCEPLP